MLEESRTLSAPPSPKADEDRDRAILARQTWVATHSIEGPEEDDQGDSSIPSLSFLSTARIDSQKWNPLRKKSGLMSVLHAQTKKGRLVSKHGRINTIRRKEEVRRDKHRYLKDFFTSMIELSWSWTLFSFAASFFISWLGFAIAWYVVVLTHGDLRSDLDDDHVMCVDNIKPDEAFTSCFLYSLETQHTIGYGGRAATEECPHAIILMCIQSIVGVIIQACMAGIVFAKFTKPTHRGETIMFSRNALISRRNGDLFLMVRLGDLRASHLIGCHVSGYLLTRVKTEEGETVPYHLDSLHFGASLSGENDDLQLFWPLVIAHKIDQRSPLYDLSPKDLQTRQFEVIISLEGTTPETGNTVQVRTSYLPSEILWGQRFEHTTVAYDKDVAKYAVSYTTINSFLPDKTPRMSAKMLEEKKQGLSRSGSGSSLVTLTVPPSLQ